MCRILGSSVLGSEGGGALPLRGLKISNDIGGGGGVNEEAVLGGGGLAVITSSVDHHLNYN